MLLPGFRLRQRREPLQRQGGLRPAGGLKGFWALGGSLKGYEGASLKGFRGFGVLGLGV